MSHAFSPVCSQHGRCSRTWAEGVHVSPGTTVDGNDACAAVAYQVSDVMATRSTGFAQLSFSSVQEAQDLAAIAHAATLESRVPFLHFFHGFRTSHETAKIAAPDAERVIVVMGSGAATVRATVARLGTAAKVGVLTVKLFRPFSVADFVAALPSTVRRIAVLERTKKPGAIGEPLYQDVVTALTEKRVTTENTVDTVDAESNGSSRLPDVSRVPRFYTVSRGGGFLEYARGR